MVKYNRELDATFQALADPTRRAIISTLARGQASVTQLARPHCMSLPAIMKHLVVLQKAGIVTQKKVGRTRHCRLAVRSLKKAEAWISQYRAFWKTQFDSLDRYLAEQPKENEQWRKNSYPRKTRLP
jgi:DNA-binding transcriptional ArsR family regulator